MKNLLKRSSFLVHEHRLAFKVGKSSLQILLRKTLYSLFESDRGLLDLQFSYSKFGQLLFKILEIIELKQGAGNTFGQGRRRATTPCASCVAYSCPHVGCPRCPRPTRCVRSRAALGHMPPRPTPPEAPRPLPAGPSGAPPVRAPAKAPWYGGIPAITASSPPGMRSI
jgi:hypothetical protein